MDHGQIEMRARCPQQRIRLEHGIAVDKLYIFYHQLLDIFEDDRRSVGPAMIGIADVYLDVTVISGDIISVIDFVRYEGVDTFNLIFTKRRVENFYFKEPFIKDLQIDDFLFRLIDL